MEASAWLRGALPAGESENGAAGGRQIPSLPAPGFFKKKVTWFGFVLPDLELEARTLRRRWGLWVAQARFCAFQHKMELGFGLSALQSTSHLYFSPPMSINHCAFPRVGGGSQVGERARERGTSDGAPQKCFPPRRKGLPRAGASGGGY